MTALEFAAVVWLLSMVAGLLGALAGLGGGVLVVPVLTLALGVDIKYAIGASLDLVIATSSGEAAVYVREGLSNIRICMFLEIATTLGAFVGALKVIAIDQAMRISFRVLTTASNFMIGVAAAASAGV